MCVTFKIHVYITMYLASDYFIYVEVFLLFAPIQYQQTSTHISLKRDLCASQTGNVDQQSEEMFKK